MNLDLSSVPEFPKTGRKGFSNHAMICSFIVMKCQGFSMLTDLVDYLNNNLLISHYCGFDITSPLPSYWTFDRFLKNFDHSVLSDIMKKQVLSLAESGIIDTSFIGLDSTPVFANTSQNNPKSFLKNKFSPDNHPKSDEDCKLGIHTASNQTNEKNYEFYWGYKNHVLVDCISGLPIYEFTTTADIHDSLVALDVLADTHSFLPVTECTFLADKGYDVKNIYNQVHTLYHGECIIPLNKRNTKNPKLLPQGNPLCEAGLAMWKDGKFSDRNRTRQKFCCPLKSSPSADCPCHHKNFYNGKKHRGCTKYITIPDDLRLSIDRNSKYFKSSYSLRTECERYNSRFKNTGQERMWVRNKASVTNLNTLAHISLLAVAIAAITSHSNQFYRRLKTVKRIA
ncbi:transposase [Lacrimispora defluvii]|uniref:transposase n=1 Tax=Lacrimispora defluvii TaxID=2719233 RepID=UPI002D1E3615|nr:transposase [Lacrimispora defluvii]